MFSKIAILALAASPLVAAHGKIAVVTGDQGGNGTGLGIQGGIVPGPGKNKVTEVDTTVFGSTNIMTDGLGKTKGSGANTVDMVTQAMAQSGNTLPQVSANGGTLSGTFHIVTTDGAGPLKAVVDPTGTGAFASGTMLEVATQVPGNGGNIKAPKQRSLIMRALVSVGIVKRASNVNEDFPMAFSVPAGMTCTGTVAGMQNVCLAKIANANKAGPFGGVVAFQMAGASSGAAATGAATGAASGTAAATDATASDATATDAKAAKKGAKKSAKFRA